MPRARIDSSFFLTFLPVWLRPFIVLGRFDRPIGIILLMLPTFWGLALVPSTPLSFYCLFALGSVVLRTAGCIINDIIDRHIDASVSRTQSRPLAAHQLRLWHAYAVLAVLFAAALLILLQLPRDIFIPAVLLVPLIIVYPYSKRVSSYPQVFLALLFNSGLLLAAQAAGKPFLSLDVMLAYLVACLLTIAYDTVYAHMDKDDDKKIGVKSLALKWGTQTRPRLLALYGMAFGLFVWLIPHHPLNVVIFIIAMVLQYLFFHQLSLASFSSCLRCFQRHSITMTLLFLALIRF